jgi:hypothetical protein
MVMSGIPHDPYVSGIKVTQRNYKYTYEDVKNTNEDVEDESAGDGH